MNASHIRSQLKAQRLNTPLLEQRTFAQRIAQNVCTQDFFHHSQHIAVYLPVQGEVDTRAIVEQARQLGKHCYLPVLCKDNPQQLCFIPFDSTTRFVSNRFNIPEPVFEESRLFDPKALDLVITPLVAFDAECHRIGMGLGFYDRTFAFLQTSPRPKTPLMCGIAYDFQQIDTTDPQPWDVTLDFVATEQRIYARSI